MKRRVVWTLWMTVAFSMLMLSACVPTKPKNLTAEATSDSTIRISWTDTSVFEGGFEIERKVGAGEFVLIATVSANTVSFVDSGLTPLTTYSYRVRAYHGSDYSAYSNEDAATPSEQTAWDNAKIIFLHHSTGEVIWGGGVSDWFTQYNNTNGTDYQITQVNYPDGSNYPWNNYPYDYWNIWVQHGGNSPYLSQATLEILTQSYNVIIWKHCFPVSDISADAGSPDISSSDKRIENYQLQYNALKAKMHQFPDVRFIVWTGAALVAGATTPEKAARARQFFKWVKNTWDESDDNIYVWDFFELETEGGYYLKNGYAVSTSDSHPNSTFAKTVAPYFCQRIVDVIEGRGDTGSLTGK